MRMGLVRLLRLRTKWTNDEGGTVSRDVGIDGTLG